MNILLLIVLLLSSVALGTGVPGCLGDQPLEVQLDDDDDDDDSGDTNDSSGDDGEPVMDDKKNAPQPDSKHEGWKTADCRECHEENAAVKSMYECAQCHGDNGTPDECGMGDQCNSCHEGYHPDRVATDNEHCAVCHAP